MDMEDTFTVYKVDLEGNVFEVTFDEDFNIIKNKLREDMRSPFHDVPLRRDIPDIKTKTKNPVKVKTKQNKNIKKEVLIKMPRKPTVGGRIRELLSLGKSDEEIIDIVKNEIANKVVPPVNCPLSLYVKDAKNKLKRAKKSPAKTEQNVTASV